MLRCFHRSGHRHVVGWRPLSATKHATDFSTAAWLPSRRQSASGIQIFVVVFALWRELHILVSQLRILEDFAFVIPDHDLFVVVIEDIAGIDRHFAAAAGSVDDELRHGVTGRVTAIISMPLATDVRRCDEPLIRSH